MHPGAALGEEPADGRVFAEGREQLDAALTQPDGHGLDALRLERVATLDLCAEQPLIRVDRVVEVLDGDSQMVDPLRLHAKRMLSADRGSPVGRILDTRERNDPADGLAHARFGLDVGQERHHLGADERLLLEERLREPPASAIISSRTSVSFSRSASASRSSAARCFVISRTASS